MSFNLKEIQKLLDMVDGSQASVLELADESGVSIRIEKNSAQGMQQMVTQQVPVVAPQPMIAVQNEPKPMEIPEKPSGSAGHPIKSPMVGTLYLAPSPEAESFVKVGQTVQVGDVLCLIEAMKMYNKIKADRAGKIIECVASDGQAVEFDQVLFTIE